MTKMAAGDLAIGSATLATEVTVTFICMSSVRLSFVRSSDPFPDAACAAGLVPVIVLAGVAVAAAVVAGLAPSAIVPAAAVVATMALEAVGLAAVAFNA